MAKVRVVSLVPGRDGLEIAGKGKGKEVPSAKEGIIKKVYTPPDIIELVLNENKTKDKQGNSNGEGRGE